MKIWMATFITLTCLLACNKDEKYGISYNNVRHRHDIPLLPVGFETCPEEEYNGDICWCAGQISAESDTVYYYKKNLIFRQNNLVSELDSYILIVNDKRYSLVYFSDYVQEDKIRNSFSVSFEGKTIIENENAKQVKQLFDLLNQGDAMAIGQFLGLNSY